jgi:AIR synthase-related protein
MLGQFVEDDPWFAGWSAVMANVSDVAAMGGTPLAVVDVYWHNESSRSELVFAGLRSAASAFGVPVVGGHTGYQPGGPQALAVAIVGRSDHALLTSFGGRPGQAILGAIDLRGEYRRGKEFWNAATDAAPERLRGDIALLAELARLGIVEACKDISMGGVAGTLLMLLEASGCGAIIDPTRVPRPGSEGDLGRWLQAFPSYGYLLCVEPENVDAVTARFVAREIDCQVIGTLDASSRLQLQCGRDTAVLWDLEERPLTGFGGAKD